VTGGTFACPPGAFSCRRSVLWSTEDGRNASIGCCASIVITQSGERRLTGIGRYAAAHEGASTDLPYIAISGHRKLDGDALPILINTQAA
jgi:hypothetical protein